MVGMGIGIMCQHLEGRNSFWERGVVACTPLEMAVASVGPLVSVTPTIRMVEDEGYIEVVANG